MFNGIVSIYKEQGFTSHDVVAKLRGIYGQKKIGHTGTLDPMAEGVLIVCLGQATKLSNLIISKDKRYIATMRLGINTDTDDITGQVTSECDPETLKNLLADEDSFKEKLCRIFSKYMGSSMQIPPMYSAIKVEGKKLYEYARAGITIERKPRPIEIFKLELRSLESEKAEITFEVECSKGTYIRSLIRDIGENLQVGASMSMLVRDEVNGITIKDSYRISDIQRMKEDGNLAASVMPMDVLLKNYPSVDINDTGVKYLQNGNKLLQKDLKVREIISDGEEQFWETVKNSDFIRVYMDDSLKALYKYDKENTCYKVFKML
ncbi:MAG: tRNA pseudouridine(55) synthase TruB [Eubacterium sp.]|nr:tRNA pseudouridine(55) synthase TruB [Eubacterium sp.]